MAFPFEKTIDPKKPLDPGDPPPHDHSLVDAADCRRALFGHPPPLYVDCFNWQIRELARLLAIK